VIVALRHLAGLLAAGALLWFLWRRLDSDDRRTRWIVAAGFVIRTLSAAALFWISYLRLPILRSQQLGNGLWFFASDGMLYMSQAAELAAGGFFHLLVGQPGWTPNFYIRTLAAFVWLLGDSAAVGILLNLVAWLGCALIVVRWTSSRLPLLAITFAPAAILWSLQPLKDSLFTLLVLLFFFMLGRFFEAHTWRSVIALAVLSAAIGSLRWYFGVMLASASELGLLIDVLRARLRLRHVLTAAATALLLICGAAFGVWGQVPVRFDTIIRMSPRDWPHFAAYMIEHARDGFDAHAGPTAIRPGPLVSRSWAPGDSDGHIDYARMVAQSKPLPRGLVRTRLLAGLTVVFIPHAVASPLGLVHVAGGRGLWWFADAETLVFDAVAVLALLAVITAFRTHKLRNPLLWQLLALVIVLTLALAYAVTNFGTLFRHREMVFVALLGIALSGARQLSADDRSEPGPDNGQRTTENGQLTTDSRS
jgi:hypothetical protein